MGNPKLSFSSMDIIGNDRICNVIDIGAYENTSTCMMIKEFNEKDLKTSNIVLSRYIDISKWESGIYIVVLFDENGNTITKENLLKTE